LPQPTSTRKNQIIFRTENEGGFGRKIKN